MYFPFVYTQFSVESMASKIADTIYGRTALECADKGEPSFFAPLPGEYERIFREDKLILTDLNETPSPLVKATS